MLVFWVIVCIMIAAALVFVLRPLFLKNPARQVGTENTGLNVYRNRMAELRAEVESGLLSESEAEMAEIELKKTLLQEVEETENQVAASTNPGSRNWWTIAVTSVLLPVIAISTYMLLGSPHLLDTSSEPDSVTSDASESHQSSINEMVDQLAARLEQQPDDAEGWLMLINSYMTLGKYQQAAAAAARLYDLVGDDPYVMLRYADALAMANNGRMSGKPAELVRKALALEPDSITGLWLAGMAESQQGNDSKAIEYWTQLKPLLQEDPESLDEVNQLISRAQDRLGMPQQLTAPGDSETAAGEAEGTSVSIVVDVSLSPDIVNDTDPKDTVFVYARAVDGPPMPLAAVREKAGNLPLQLTLDDSLAMSPEMKLSDYEQVKVTARISKSGNAMPQSGDFIGEALAVINNKQTSPISIIINKQIP